MAGIEVRNLVKSYGGVRALHGIDFDVAEGEMLSLLGPSGCGKTTTLRCIAGLENADRGTIRIGDALVSDFDGKNVMPPERRGIGMVFQSYAIWPHMTVYKNVAYPLVVRGAPKAEIGPAVQEALHLVDMDDFAERPSTNLSGGQQQRVALARALVGKPRVLLLDEPLSNLDAKLRDQMRIELRQIQERTGVTALYVTHDQSEAMALSDRIIVMNKGRIEQVATPREIYRSPSTAFVAAFVGTSNFLRARITGEAAGSVVPVTLEGGQTIRAADRGFSGDVLISLRPQFCSVVAPDAAVGPDLDMLAGRIDTLTYFGERSEIRIRVGEKSIVAYLDFGATFGVGDDVKIVFSPEHAVPLPGDSAPPSAEADATSTATQMETA